MKPAKKLGAGKAVPLLTLLTACAVTHRPAVPLPPVPARLEGYSALCIARWRGAEKAGHAQVAIAYLDPGRIRLEAQDAAGSARVVLVARDEGALWLDPSRRQFRKYPNGSMASRDLMGLSLMPQALGALLWGPELMMRSATCETPSQPGGVDFRRCRLPEGAELRMPPGGDAPAVLSRPDGPPLEIVWDREDPGSAPRWLEIKQADPRTVLRLETRQIRLTPPEEDLFAIDPPPGFSPAPQGAP